MILQFKLKSPVVSCEQFDGQEHKMVKRCTGGGQGNLKPVPEGLEVFGSTSFGVPVGPKQVVPIKKTDWIVFVEGQSYPVVVSDAVFQLLLEPA